MLTAYVLGGCASMPKAEHKTYAFPTKHAFVGDVKRPYEKLGLVRTRIDFVTLDLESDEDRLCANYYNKAAIDLVRRAKEKNADAVIDVQSVVFLEDGRHQSFKTPECSDDGGEGQILLQGIAVRWKVH